MEFFLIGAYFFYLICNYIFKPIVQFMFGYEVETPYVEGWSDEEEQSEHIESSDPPEKEGSAYGRKGRKKKHLTVVEPDNDHDLGPYCLDGDPFDGEDDLDYPA